jgi:hypothetical protein
LPGAFPAPPSRPALLTQLHDDSFRFALNLTQGSVVSWPPPEADRLSQKRAASNFLNPPRVSNDQNK